MPLRKKVMEDVAELFAVLAHPTRVRMLSMLHQGEHDVSDLREHLGVPAANVSQHLAALRSHHLVTGRRDGTRVYYAIRDPRVADLINRALDILDTDMSQARAIQKAIQLVRLKA
ncbi:MAG: winged helix-turn-helix transcriptional regulator [candidate division NC10 bacterium]|nr:winged helix-turn-helix transcriptional regulator [candidate division NC10 bacterium]